MNQFQGIFRNFPCTFFAENEYSRMEILWNWLPTSHHFDSFFYLGKKPYGYKPKYGKKPKEDQDWEEPKEETHEDGDWKDDTDQDWEE